MALANSLELDWLVNPVDSLLTRYKLIVLSIFLAALPCGIGCKDQPSAQASATEVPAKAAPATLKPVDVASTDPAHYVTTGPLVAEQQADISAPRDGRILTIAVEIGDHVRRGQVLASLDDRSLRTAIASQTARLASLRAQVNEWEAEQKSVEADLRRADQMRAEKIISEENWEHAKYKLDETIAEVARYHADAVASEGDLNTAKLQLEQSQIIAPFTGVIGRQSLRVAQEVKKGDVLFWVTAEAPLRILFTVPESAMAAYTTGAPLELTTLDYPELHQPARILRVSPVVDPASGSIQVVGAVVRPSPLLKPGMAMQVRVRAQGQP